MWFFGVEGFYSLGLTLPVRADVMGKDGGIMGSVHEEGPWQGNDVPRPWPSCLQRAPEAHPPPRLRTARVFLPEAPLGRLSPWGSINQIPGCAIANLIGATRTSEEI